MRLPLQLLILAWFLPAPALFAGEDGSSHGGDWAQTMVDARTSHLKANARQNAEALWDQIARGFPVECDWVLQDAGPSFAEWLTVADPQPLEQTLTNRLRLPTLVENQRFHRDWATSVDSLARLRLYVWACEQRRGERLQHLPKLAPRIVFTRHRTIRPSFFAYTEGLSDAQAERHFLPGSSLAVLEMNGLYGKVRTLLEDPTGAIRDPAVSWDGERIAFAWKKSLNEDDYHLYELEVASGKVRQITSGLGHADYEPAYLPSGDLIFSSTRCVQTVDCFWTEVSNLYTCDPNGRYLRRLGFDQVHTVYPQVMDDGRVIYTRWDYNDRGQVFPQPLFQMNADGTAQTEFYGNSSWFPTTIAHARGIPGTGKVLAILCGHHSSQAGKLAVIDPSLGRQENAGVQLVAPFRHTPAVRIDSYGQEGELWQYPFPLTTNECLTTYAPLGWDSPRRRAGDAAFAIYWMDFDGRRELLVADPNLPCNQPVPLVPRPAPRPRPSLVDYQRDTGVFYMQDIHAGQGLPGVPRGTVKKLRVVALEFRPAGIGHSNSRGPGGGALISTPIAIGNGAWDVKTVLGEATVHEDGSALFSVPARTPVYFQALDDRGYVVQTMRTWSTLQPGERLSCVGCHDNKNSVPQIQYQSSAALQRGVETLTATSFSGRGFSFPKDVQPILDRHCIRCHQDRTKLAQARRASPAEPAAGPGTNQTAFSLLAEPVRDATAKRWWTESYLTLTAAKPDGGTGPYLGDSRGSLVSWITSQSAPEPLQPFAAGAARSKLIELLEAGHQGVALSRSELTTIACWIDLVVPFCGNYLEANAWTEQELAKYRHYAAKREQMQRLEAQHLRDYLAR